MLNYDIFNSIPTPHPFFFFNNYPHVKYFKNWIKFKSTNAHELGIKSYLTNQPINQIQNSSLPVIELVAALPPHLNSFIICTLTNFSPPNILRLTRRSTARDKFSNFFQNQNKKKVIIKCTLKMISKHAFNST